MASLLEQLPNVAEGMHEAEQHIMGRQESNDRVGLQTCELVPVCHHKHGRFKMVAGSVDAALKLRK